MELKNRTLLVFKFLWETTDEAHTASLEQIKDYLERCGLSRPDSRPIKNDIDQLIALGADIVVDRRVQNRYFVATRHFDTAEVKLLIDAVQSSRFITPKKSRTLIAKLSTFVEPSQKQLLNRQLYVDCRAKADNEAVLRVVDHIHTAIADGRKVTFRYFDYTPTKEKVHRHDGALYAVSPYAMLWNSDQYYMVGFSDARQLVATYRIDRIDSLSITAEAAVPRPQSFRIADYFAPAFSMFSGEEREVELLCENELMSSIIDRFGESVRTEITDERHFKVTVSVALSDNFYGWVFASGGKMRLLNPPEAVRGFREILEKYAEN